PGRHLRARGECDGGGAADRGRPEARAGGGPHCCLARRAAARPGAVRTDRNRDGGATVITLYNAARCPYVARVRIVLAEKRIEMETVEIDLSDRPAWFYEKNPTGRVPVIEEDGGPPLPESAVIMEFLEERYPEPALLPADPEDRGFVRLLIFRDGDLTRPYYALRRGVEGAGE